MNTRLADITVQQVLAAVATIAVVWAIAALTVHHFQVCGERSGAQHQVDIASANVAAGGSMGELVSKLRRQADVEDACARPLSSLSPRFP